MGVSGGERLSRRLVLLLAVSCGASVANLYYAQPLLHTIARALSVPNSTAGLLVTVTQIGYVVGLLLLVPLGDLLSRRKLITAMLLVAAAAQVGATVAAGFALFAATLGIASVCSAVAQIIVPMSSTLAGPAERGRVVGMVMSGLLIGILLARTVSGLVAAAFGWRAVFGVAAATMLLLAATLWRALPDIETNTDMSYRSLLGSIGRLVREQPVLRQRMALGAVGFGCFSTLWTALAFLLSGAPYHYGNATIGLFGLVGAAGASAAPIAGRLADRGHGRLVTTGGLVVLLASWGVIALGKSSLAALIVGIAVLDLAIQSLQINHQSVIYALHHEARSRLTTAFMVSSFLGGAITSALTSTLYASSGWGAVCILGASVSAIGLCVWLATLRVGSEPTPSGVPSPAPRSS
jgi:predicted MFS family arabinose efflux permease